MPNDPILAELDRLASNPQVAGQLAEILRHVTEALHAGDVMAWETVPLALFGDVLPAGIASCWIFVIRAGVDTGAERHPNSHQRSISLAGQGEFQLRGGQEWERYPLVSNTREPLERRGVSIPANTWHRLFAGPEPWGMVSFHTVPASELIEERPLTPNDVDGGPTQRHRYTDRA